MDERATIQGSPPTHIWRHAAYSTARIVGLVLVIPATLAITTGWLYWLRALVTSMPGPRVVDALPLDELPEHAAIPILIYLPVVAIAALLLGLCARALKLDRISATLALGFGVAISLFIFNVVSIYVVRQIPLIAAVHVAEHLQPMYLAAVFAGVAGALLGLPERAGRSWNRLIAWLVALAGVDDLYVAIIPSHRRHGLLSSVSPLANLRFSNALIVPTGFLLLITARGLSRRRHPAFLLALWVLGASTVLHLFVTRSYASAVAAALIGLLLFARRQDFPSPSRPRSRARTFEHLLIAIAGAFCFGVVTLFINAAFVAYSISTPSVAIDSARALIGLSSTDLRYLPDSLATWFPWTVMSAAAAGVLWTAATWIARPRPIGAAGEFERARALALVRRWGADTVAPFALRHDKALFFVGSGAGITTRADEDREAVVAYRVVRGIALATGDPIGPPECAPEAFGAFVDFAHMQGCEVAVLGASDRLLSNYRTRGFHVFHHGDEATIDVKRFSLEGGRMRAVRQAVHRLERRGYVSEVAFVGDIDSRLRSELLDVEYIWLRGKQRKGFTMELDNLFTLEDDDAMFVIGRSPDGGVAGFLHLAMCPAGRAISLSSMPRLYTTPNGFNSWLIVETVRWAATNDYERLSLNFAPFSHVLAGEAEHSLSKDAEREVLYGLKAGLSLQLDNLHRFNRQFSPDLQPRFVVYEHRTDLPLVAVAAMAAEGYLPFSERIRGRLWRGRSLVGDAGADAADPGHEHLKRIGDRANEKVPS